MRVIPVRMSRHGAVLALVTAAALAVSPADGAAQDAAARTPAPPKRTQPPQSAAAARQDTTVKQLRVCADANNLPFSNQRQEGFENKLAELIAHDWGMKVTYTWWPQRRGFVRETLRAKKCDLVMGVPLGYDPLLTTAPYYSSTYVFAYPTAKKYNLKSLGDPRLKKLRIGVNLIGDDYMNPPPVHALAERGVIGVHGYSIYGDYSKESPPLEIMDALAKGEIDVAIVWGPLAGYYATKRGFPLTIVPLPPGESTQLPFEYDISMGVRRSDKELKARLEETFKRRDADIKAILKEYGVPLVPRATVHIQPAEDDD